jgi:Fe-S cluster assembly protein SufD
MTVAEAQDLYAARFDRFLAGRLDNEPAWLTTVRRTALERFQALGIPTTRHEEWRFTPVSALADQVFRDAADFPVAVTRAEIARFTVRQLSCTLLVFVNGRFSPELSNIRSAPKGVIFTNLAAMLDKDPGLVDPYFTRCASFEKHAFTALNTAFADDGAVVYIPANAVVSEPVHILYFSTATTPVITHPRTIIVAGDNSQAKFIESYAGIDGEKYFTNAVTEIVGGESSNV